ncbi:hypothetical protein BGX23_008034 [Mortierella sp. AD031]|nr:hypothetical protein BGX23_008034 [Mortierella sp. AD031]KAG0202997.1 hypothetical protein BGX33_009357 [Mortierella sp. NVP41]
MPIQAPQQRTDYRIDAVIDIYQGHKDGRGKDLRKEFKERLLCSPLASLPALLMRLQVVMDRNEDYEGFVASGIQTERRFNLALDPIPLFRLLDDEAIVNVRGHLPAGTRLKAITEDGGQKDDKGIQTEPEVGDKEEEVKKDDKEAQTELEGGGREEKGMKESGVAQAKAAVGGEEEEDIKEGGVVQAQAAVGGKEEKIAQIEDKATGGKNNDTLKKRMHAKSTVPSIGMYEGWHIGTKSSSSSSAAADAVTVLDPSTPVGGDEHERKKVRAASPSPSAPVPPTFHSDN